MGPSESEFAPVGMSERYSSLDVIRGVALFGVLLANLVTSFRVCLYEYCFVFHTHQGIADVTVDYLREFFVSGKAITLFTLVFGVGIAAQYDRARARGVSPVWFLVRRLLVLFCFGLLHFLLLWDGDVLMTYAVCGLIVVPFAKARLKVLTLAGLLGLIGNAVLYAYLESWLADEATWLETLKGYSDWYANGDYPGLVQMRWDLLPFSLMAEIPSQCSTVVGLTLLGMAAWRFELVQHPETRSRVLWRVAEACGVLGFGATIVEIFIRANATTLGERYTLWSYLARLPLALAYGAAMLLYLHHRPRGKWRSYFAAAGRMALTNYLMQSLIFSFIFYGYGLGLFGKVSTFTATLLGVLVYLWQLRFSRYWLKRHPFGPVEWLWRVLAYGKRRVASPMAVEG